MTEEMGERRAFSKGSPETSKPPSKALIASHLCSSFDTIDIQLVKGVTVQVIKQP